MFKKCNKKLKKKKILKKIYQKNPLYNNNNIKKEYTHKEYI